MIFLRHPRPEVAPGVCYGRLDLSLAADAATEIGAACTKVERCGAVVTSPSPRCRLLADALAAASGDGPREDERLLELDFGAWEGLPWTEINRAESDPWAADPWNLAPPGGETFAALHARVAAALAEIPPDAVVVTHAGPIRAARMILTGARFETVFAESVPHATPLSFASEEVGIDG